MFEVTVKNMTIGQMDKQTDRTDQVYLLDTVQYKKVGTQYSGPEGPPQALHRS